MQLTTTHEPGRDALHRFKDGVWDGINRTPEAAQVGNIDYRDGYFEGFYTRKGQEQGEDGVLLANRACRRRVRKRKIVKDKSEKPNWKSPRSPMNKMKDALIEAEKHAEKVYQKEDHADLMEAVGMALDIWGEVEEHRVKRWDKWKLPEKDKVKDEKKNGKKGKGKA